MKPASAISPTRSCRAFRRIRVSAVVRFEPRELFFAELNARASGAAWANTDNTVKADGYVVLGAAHRRAAAGEVPQRLLAAAACRI